MRFALRSLLTLAALVAASCTIPAPAFAQDTPASGFAAMDAAASAVASAPASPSPAPSAPTPSAPAETPAVLEAGARDPRETIIDESFAKYLHGLGPHLSEYLHGRLHAWKEELKALLLELPLS